MPYIRLTRSFLSNRYTHNVIFHEIVEPGRLPLDSAGRFWMDRGRFEMVLDALTDRKDVTITFDDGFQSDVAIALEELVSRRLHGRFFITVAALDRPGYLQTQDIKTLSDSGMTVGTHGFRHISWRHLRRDEVVAEVTRSRHILEDLIGAPVTELSMPSGQYNRRVLDALRDLSFERVYSVDGPWARVDDWLQPRFAVTCCDTPETIQAALNAPRSGLVGLSRWGKSWIKRHRWW